MPRRLAIRPRDREGVPAGKVQHLDEVILGDPGAISRGDTN